MVGCLTKHDTEEYAGGFPEIIEAFGNLADPRTGRNKRHYFGEIILMANSLSNSPQIGWYKAAFPSSDDSTSVDVWLLYSANNRSLLSSVDAQRKG